MVGLGLDYESTGHGRPQTQLPPSPCRSHIAHWASIEVFVAVLLTRNFAPPDHIFRHIMPIRPYPLPHAFDRHYVEDGSRKIFRVLDLR